MNSDHYQTSHDGETKEQEFYNLITQKYSVSKALQTLDSIDWDFSGFTTQYLTHRFHSYPARFIPQIPFSFLNLFTKKGDTILDPMCGCGTTLVEAFLNGRDSIGNDFNPLATLITKTKVTLIPDKELAFLQRRLARMDKSPDLDDAIIEERLSNLPNRKLSSLFDKTVIAKLESIRETLLELKSDHQDIFDLGRVALSSTIWSVVENGDGIEVDALFMKKTDAMCLHLKQMTRKVKDPPDVTVQKGDARRLNLDDGTIDLIVTSPPYVNALDYYRIHMYNMLWLGMDFDLFKKHEIGVHSRFIFNRFRLLSEYLGDMLRSMMEMNRVMKSGGICAIVIGNSSLEYELIESHKYFASMAEKIGFTTKKNIFRNIDTARKYKSTGIGLIDDEYIIVLQKTDECSYSSLDDDFVSDVVEAEMKPFEKQINKIQGTSIRWRKPSKERLKQNIERIADAIEHIPQDIRFK